MKMRTRTIASASIESDPNESRMKNFEKKIMNGGMPMIARPPRMIPHAASGWNLKTS